MKETRGAGLFSAAFCVVMTVVFVAGGVYWIVELNLWIGLFFVLLAMVWLRTAVVVYRKAQALP